LRITPRNGAAGLLGRSRNKYRRRGLLLANHRTFCVQPANLIGAFANQVASRSARIGQEANDFEACSLVRKLHNWRRQMPVIGAEPQGMAWIFRDVRD
jgi:hypothetical protein